MIIAEQFFLRPTFPEDYKAFLEVLQQKAAGGRQPGNGHNYQPEQQAFWAAIASFEAMRRFQKDADFCDSCLVMEKEYKGIQQVERGAPMEFFYESTSGTIFKAYEWRQTEDEPATLPEPAFFVSIPVNRDQPGRSHYESLRRGGTYRDFWPPSPAGRRARQLLPPHQHSCFPQPT